eukprot:781388_1
MAFCCPSSANEEDLELNEKLSALEEAKGTGGVKVDSNKVSGRQTGAFKNFHLVALLLCLVLTGGLLYVKFGCGGGTHVPSWKVKQPSTDPEPNTNANGHVIVSNTTNYNGDGTDLKYDQSPNLRDQFVPDIVKAIFSRSAGKSNVFCPAGAVMLLKMVTPAFNKGSDARNQLTKALVNPYPLEDIQKFKDVIKVGNLFAARGNVTPTGDLKEYLDDHKADFGRLTKTAVNKFVSKTTEGVIQTILDKEPDDDIMAMLVNTILVQDSYLDAFDDSDDPVTFNTSDEKQLQLPAPTLMQGRMQYYKGTSYEAFAKFGKTQQSDSGKSTNVVIILPDLENGLVSDPNKWIEDRLDSEWNTIAQGLKLSENGSRVGTKPVRLPMFKVEGDHDVKPALMQIGLGKMFSQPVDNVKSSYELKISAVKQKAVAIVCKKGFKAAAATRAVMSKESYCPNKIKYIHIDHSFIAIITYGEYMLFDAAIVEPTDAVKDCESMDGKNSNSGGGFLSSLFDWK